MCKWCHMRYSETDPKFFEHGKPGHWTSGVNEKGQLIWNWVRGSSIPTTGTCMTICTYAGTTECPYRHLPHFAESEVQDEEVGFYSIPLTWDGEFVPVSQEDGGVYYFPKGIIKVVNGTVRFWPADDIHEKLLYLRGRPPLPCPSLTLTAIPVWEPATWMLRGRFLHHVDYKETVKNSGFAYECGSEPRRNPISFEAFEFA